MTDADTTPVPDETAPAETVEETDPVAPIEGFGPEFQVQQKRVEALQVQGHDVILAEWSRIRVSRVEMSWETFDQLSDLKRRSSIPMPQAIEALHRLSQFVLDNSDESAHQAVHEDVDLITDTLRALNP